MPGKKMMGYKKGGSLEMVEKDGKKVPFYAADGKGKMAEGGEVKKEKKKRVTSKDKLAAKKAKDAKLASSTTAKPRKMVAENNTMPPVPKPQAVAAPKTPMGGGGGMPPMGGGGGMPPMGGGAAKPPMMAGAGGMGAKMPMMKEGGKVKKKAKSKSYGKGGKIRGAGIAKKGVKKCKMR